MPLNPKEFEKVFFNHFQTISQEQFLDNLKAACPYLFDEDLSKLASIESDSSDRVLTRSEDLSDIS